MFSRFWRWLRQEWERSEGGEYEGMAGEKVGKHGTHVVSSVVPV